MTVKSWQDRLTNTFAVRGVVGNRHLPAIFELEDTSGAWFVETFKGHRVLKDAFMDFYADTVMTCFDAIRLHGYPADSLWYGFLLQNHRTLFMSHRTAECLALKGYWFDAFALLRNVFQQTLRFAAIANGFSNFARSEGIEDIQAAVPWSDREFQRVHRARLAEEVRIERWAFGEQSDLSDRAKQQLDKLRKLFNRQVHGFRLSSHAVGARWLYREGEVFSLGPLPDEDAAANFMNRSDAIAWCTLRLLPFLQAQDRRFPNEWRNKWTVLDESFRYSVEGLGRLGKPIAEATIELVEKKFGFSVDDLYRESADAHA